MSNRVLDFDNINDLENLVQRIAFVYVVCEKNSLYFVWLQT